jgi:alkanesulfonate monooxygenase SsuD/methylene tetrahydromethanopterin reductase-like flavin-dependent oxidoreductase (luciferase family)
MDEATRATMASQLILGTPEQVAARIAEFGEVLGEGGQFIARSYFPGLDTERAGERIRLLGEVKKLLA